MFESKQNKCIKGWRTKNLIKHFVRCSHKMNNPKLMTCLLLLIVLVLPGIGDLSTGSGRAEEEEYFGKSIPDPSYPYREENVYFVNEESDVKLAGTLTLPDAEELYPASVLISGGGAHDRDYTMFGQKPFMVMADYLSRRGIAVLRYDNRGTGESTGNRSISTTEDYAGDALAAVKFLKSRSDIDPDLIGLIGHSEGGTIGSLVAKVTSDVGFLVMIAAPGLSGVEYNLQYEESVGKAMGLIEKELEERRAFQKKVFEVVLNEKEAETAGARLVEIYREEYPDLTKEKIEAGINRLISPWFVYSLSYDPSTTLKSLRCPVLVIFGGKDVQVPPEGNAKAIRHALAASESEDYRVEIIPDLNHLMQTSITGSPEEYGKIEETISPILLEVIGSWARERLID